MLASGAKSAYLQTSWTAAGSISDDLPKLTRSTFIGILIAITGNILISFALNLQKLAHKRVEARIRAQREKETTHPRHSDNPSLNEHDEERAHRTTPPPEPTASGGRSLESEPLIPFPDSSSSTHAYGTLSASTSGSTLTESHPRPSFASYFVPSWLHRHRRTPPPSDAHLETVIPVDVISEESALRQQRPRSPSQKKRILEDGNEAEYLKSKLWFVSTLNYIESNITNMIRWLGFFLMNVGETGNFISYAWAPASVVAPLGTVRGRCRFCEIRRVDVDLVRFNGKLSICTSFIERAISQGLSSVIYDQQPLNLHFSAIF
ncbi:hypothetical protein H0H87_001163 [Tephrocybe sp. NHM501043]|nr:hypothetical protein H0H87_001163 [Tephrocybe sp. NHM501043]